MSAALGCLRSCGDFWRMGGGCAFFSFVKGSNLPAGLVDKVEGEEKHPKKGEVEDEVPKQI